MGQVCSFNADLFSSLVHEPDVATDNPSGAEGSADGHGSCHHCGIMFRNQMAFSKHMMDVHNISRPCECSKCGKCFMHMSSLKRHRDACDNVRSHSCHICGRLFHRKDTLQDHIKVKHYLRPRHFKTRKLKDKETNFCKNCGVNFQTKSYLLVHRQKCKSVLAETATGDTSELEDVGNDASKDGEITHKVGMSCTDCSVQFPTSLAYCEHMKEQHNNPKPYMCEKCNKTFMHNSTLNRHKQSCEDKQTFVCHVCGKGFHRKDYLQQHLKGEHKRKMGVAFKCKTCGETFQFKSWLLSHKINCKDVFGSAPTSKKMVKKMCSGEERGIEDAKLSRRSVGGYCTDCFLHFKSQLQFNKHMRDMHGNLQPYRCDKCRKSFSQLSSLSRHKDGCENKRMVFCEVCGRGFHRMDYLTEHMKGKHKKAKSTYFCRGCGEEFQYKSWLLTHKASCPGLVQSMAENVVAKLEEESRAAAVARVVQYVEQSELIVPKDEVESSDYV
jgi:KRAB domain-containing zinc finger protein